jgi:hypothetical protein
MFQPIKKFRSDIRIFTNPLPFFFIPLGLITFVLGISGGYKHGFTNIPDLLFVIFFPWSIWLVCYLFLNLMKLIFPITIFHNGIKCYNYIGLYHFVEWHQITKVYRQSVEGYLYVFVETKNLKRPLTIPLYLENMEDFVNLIKKKDTTGLLAIELE